MQDLYKDGEQKKKANKGKVEDKEVILIKPYKISRSTSSIPTLSFIDDEVNNIMKYMKFI